MSKIKQMQGVSAKLEFLRVTDNKKRHPAHCKYHKGTGKDRICNCKDNQNMYMFNCKSAKNCEYYEE